MFKVPRDPANPSYTDAFTVSFWQWLTSSKQQRGEWRTRRDAVGRARVARADARAQEASHLHRQAKAAHRQAKREAKQRIKRTVFKRR